MTFKVSAMQSVVSFSYVELRKLITFT